MLWWDYGRACEVGRCHKMMEHFEMKVITAADSGGRQLPQSKRVHYVQHLRREINSLYEENKRLRNERCCCPIRISLCR